jgi:phage-related protein
MKKIQFLGDSLKSLREFPEDAKHDVGYQLELPIFRHEPN